MKRIFPLLFVSAVLASGIYAQDTTPEAAKKQGRIAKRRDNQQKRIGQGVESGALTPAEAARLETKEANLNKEIRRDRKDGGGLTRKERVKIEHQQDRMSRRIAKQKHDKQKTN